MPNLRIPLDRPTSVGRFLAPLVLIVSACGGEAGPRTAKTQNFRAPSTTVHDDVARVANFAPREQLEIVEQLPRGSDRLLFLKSRATQPVAAGGVSWHDAERNRTLLFEGARVRDLPDQRATAQYRQMTATTRTVLEYELGPVRAGESLIRLIDENGTLIRGVGVVDTAANGLLGQLTNAGWATFAEDGSLYFAAALRPELRRYDADGRLRWIATWPPPVAPLPPRLVARSGSVHAEFTVVQHGLAAGPDGNVYVLASTGGGSPTRLLVFTRDGEWLRTGDVASGDAVFVNRRGAALTLPAERALAGGDAATRQAFEPFTLPSLMDEDTLRLEEYRGRVTVLNFWASWCGPCRLEMPLLEAFAREIDGTGAVVIGLNEDAAPERGRAFLREIGVTFPSAEGRGRQRSRYRYAGLPYTVVLDRDLRVIRTIHGFGGDIDDVRAAVRKALHEPD